MNAHTRAEALRLVDEIEDEASTRHECARQVDLQLKAVLLGCNKLRALLSASDPVYTARVVGHAAGLSTISVPESMKGKLVEIRVIEEPAK